jgi:hypothetical protein
MEETEERGGGRGGMEGNVRKRRNKKGKRRCKEERNHISVCISVPIYFPLHVWGLSYDRGCYYTKRRWRLPESIPAYPLIVVLGYL